jgi:RNA polymerase sigma-70 factor (ECF subfamily)
MSFEQSNFHQASNWFKIKPVSLDSNLEKLENTFVAENILNRIASGDKSAVQDCLDNYGGLVWSLARRMLPNQNEAEDAVQEIFVEIWKNAERFDETKSSETTYVAMIARRRLIDRLRKTARQPKIDSFEDILVEPSKDETIQTSIEAKQAAKAMRELRPEQQKVLLLSIIQGYSHQEISDALKMPLGTVKTHARRGLIEVREIIENKKTNIGREVSAL